MSDASGADQDLLATIEHQVLWLTINRPDAGNAITPMVRNRIIEHLEDASTDFGVRCVVLTAAGESGKPCPTSLTAVYRVFGSLAFSD